MLYFYKMEEAIVFIDAGYLSFISRFFGNGKHLKFKIEKFSENLAKQRSLNCKKIYYYTAPPYQSPKPNEKENKRKANYDKFIEKLRNVKPQIIIREGRCQKDEKGLYHQKGVDTILTMDLLKSAQSKEAKNFILLTADTDFVPVMAEIQKDHGINLILAYFTDKRRKSAFSLSNHLWDSCKNKILINKGHFQD